MPCHKLSFPLLSVTPNCRRKFAGRGGRQKRWGGQGNEGGDLESWIWHEAGKERDGRWGGQETYRPRVARRRRGRGDRVVRKMRRLYEPRRGLRRFEDLTTYFISFRGEADFRDSSPHSWFPLSSDRSRGSKLPHGNRAIQGTRQI